VKCVFENISAKYGHRIGKIFYAQRFRRNVMLELANWFCGNIWTRT